MLIEIIMKKNINFADLLDLFAQKQFCVNVFVL